MDMDVTKHAGFILQVHVAAFFVTSMSIYMQTEVTVVVVAVDPLLRDVTICRFYYKKCATKKRFQS